jgi:tetratricopeptide (TPR) repeat protein
MRLLRTALLAGVVGLMGNGVALAQQHSASPDPNPGVTSPPVAAQSGPYATGIAALKAKHYHEAAAAFDALTEGAPKDPRAWALLGAAYAGEKNWKASRKAYERAIKLAPDDLAGHAGLGLALQAMKDPALQAESDWLKAKAAACAGSCPEAAQLKALEGAGLYSTT